MNQRLVTIGYIPLVSIFKLCHLEEDWSQSEWDVLGGAVSDARPVPVQRRAAAARRKRQSRGGETRGGRGRNERLVPRNKNKQSLTPKQQWNSQMGSGLYFIWWRTFSRQPLSAPLAGFSQHPCLIQPASILSPMKFRPLAIDHIAIELKGAVGRVLWGKLGDTGFCMPCTHRQALTLF